jgi:hypothetical protein
MSRLVSVLFPPTCVLCGAPGLASGGGRDLCPGCAAELPHNRDCCFQCAVPFDSPMPFGTRCAACQRRPPPFETSLAAFRYEAAIPNLVGGAKFRGRLNLVRLLGQCLADRVREVDPPRPEVLMPVPLHRVSAAHPRLQPGPGDRARRRPGSGPADRSCLLLPQRCDPAAGRARRARTPSQYSRCLPRPGLAAVAPCRHPRRCRDDRKHRRRAEPGVAPGRGSADPDLGGRANPLILAGCHINLKRAVEPQRLKGRKGAQCLASMPLFAKRVNVVRIVNSCSSLRPLRLCGSKCRI